MATKSKKTEPTVIRGSHSTRTEYPDGRVEFVTHWDELVRDVAEAINNVGAPVEAIKPKRKKKTV